MASFPPPPPPPPWLTSWPKRGQCRLRSPCSGCGRRDLPSPSPAGTSSRQASTVKRGVSAGNCIMFMFNFSGVCARHPCNRTVEGAQSSAEAYGNARRGVTATTRRAGKDVTPSQQLRKTPLARRCSRFDSLDGLQEATGLRCAHEARGTWRDRSVCVRARIMHLVHLLFRQEPETR